MRAVSTAGWFFAKQTSGVCFRFGSCWLLLLSNSVSEGFEDVVCSRQALLGKN